MKILIVDDDYLFRETLVQLLRSKLNFPVIGIGTSEKTAIQMACSKLKIPVIDIKGIEKQDFQEKNISEIIENLFLLKIPEIPQIEILPFLEEPKKEKEKLFFGECLKFISFVGQPKTVRIRSPCNMGIFIKA